MKIKINQVQNIILALNRYDNYNGEQTTECQGCGYYQALVYFEPKYNGYRGGCPSCNGNWAES